MRASIFSKTYPARRSSGEKKSEKVWLEVRKRRRRRCCADGKEKVFKTAFFPILPSVIFSIKIVAIDIQLDGTAEAFSLSDKSKNPVHKNVKISVENVNRFPIKHVIIFDKYITPLLKCNEVQFVHCAYYDSDDARKWPSKMAVLTDEYERNDRGVPQWFNINYEDVDGNEMYQSFELKDFEGTLYYALEGINEI